MPKPEFDVCIIGQGIAGTALAWALRWAGKRVAVVDRGDTQSSSRVAAGLITPITGQRFVKSRRFDEFRATAQTFYRRAETETGRRFLHETPMVRLFANRNEREAFAARGLANFGDSLLSSAPQVDVTVFNATHGGFEMSGARLDVVDYLNASREMFSRDGHCYEADIDASTDLDLTQSSVHIPKLDLRARHIVFCQGFAGAVNPWFRRVPFDAAKGEILTVRIPGLCESRVFHRGVWMARLDSDLYRVGATYDRDNLDGMPTPAGREELCSRLREFVRVPFEVVDHDAAVRPIIAGKSPAIGFHPEFPQLGYFNGLASKGALQAPWLAERFTAAMTSEAEVPAEFDVTNRLRGTS